MPEDDARLPRNVEALLRAEALPEPDWSAQAERTLARLKDVRPGTTESNLLDAPFPDERSETASVAPPVSVPAASGSAGSLAALARQVAKKDTRAGAQDIARESLSAALAARATSDIVAERVRRGRAAASEPASPSVSPPASAPVAAAAAPAAVAAPAQIAVPSQPAARSSRVQWLAFGGVGLAAAAALLLFFRPAPEVRNSESAATVAVAPAEPKNTPPSAPPDAVATQAPVAAEAVPTSEPAAVALAPKDGVDERKAAAKSEPASPTLPAAKAEPLASKSRPSIASTGGSEQQRVAAASSPTRPAPAAVVLEETASAPGGGNVGGALRPAEGTTTGGLPARPGTGAVQAALGSVMGAAKACLAGATASAPAQVTFGSDGRVHSATVSGPLAGTPAAQCVEAALKRARVSPFTNPTFSLPTTVRP